MAPVRLLDTPGYFVITNVNAILPDEYRDLKNRGFDFTLNSPAGSVPGSIKTLTEQIRGGGSEYRPLTYQELDTNFKELYPIGSVYMNADDERNPRELIGFGVWERLSSGTTLMGVDAGIGSSTDPRNKILNASKTGSIITLKLQAKPTAAQDAANRLQPNSVSSAWRNKRKFNYYPGMDINVQGLKKPNGEAGPSGKFTILSVDSDLGVNNQIAPQGTAELDKAASDQNLIKIVYSGDRSFNGDYNIGGASDSFSDNAYVTYHDKSVLSNDTNSSGRVGVGITGGKRLADVDQQQFPPHAHDFASLRQSNRSEAATGYIKSTKEWYQLDDKDNWVEEGNKSVPSGTSTIDETGYRSDIASQGSGTSQTHENRQPYMAVHMWKRIQ